MRGTIRAAIFIALLAGNPPGRAQVHAEETAASNGEGGGAKQSFERWLTEKDAGRFHLVTRVGNPRLSAHQRLKVQVEIQVDGAALAHAKGDGQLIFLLEVRDAAGRPYRMRHEMQRAEGTRISASQNVIFSQDLFIVPGDYRVAAGVYDPQSGEHSAQQKMLHVAPLKNDPLPEAWDGMPEVEFLQPAAPLDETLLPYVKGNVRVTLNSEKRIGLKVIVNTTPAPTRHALRNGESHFESAEDLLAAMKVLAQAELTNGEFDLALADLARQKIVFEQRRSGALDWGRLREALGAANPNKIDVASLANRSQNAQFFAGEVEKRLDAEKPLPVVIVLSQVMMFEGGEDLHPLKVENRPEGLFYYVRFHEPVERLPSPAIPERVGFRRSRPLEGMRADMMEPIDFLEPVMKTLHPRVFDIYEPEQFRKVLRTIVDEVGKL